MANHARLIRELRNNPLQQQSRDRAVAAAISAGRVIEPHFPAQSGLMAGDPASDAGVKVAMSELADDVLLKLESAGVNVLIATLTFPDSVAPGTAFNVQTGAYFGGGPAVVEGDLLTLPIQATEFEGGEIFVTLNGQDLDRGAMAGQGQAYWVSATQMALNSPLRIFPGNVITIRRVLKE